MSKLTNPLDKAMTFKKQELAVFDQVDDVVNRCIISGNPMPAFQMGFALRRSGQIAGIALAKLLYEMRERWDSFASDDDFVSMVEAYVGISQWTYNNYIDMWEWVARDRPELWGKPVHGLIKCVGAAKEEQLDEDDWNEIANADNVDAINGVIKRVRGYKTRSASVVNLWVRRDGQIQVRIGEGPYEPIGSINRKHKLADRVLERMKRIGTLVDALE
jgi:hypothetical protein